MDLFKLLRRKSSRKHQNDYAQGNQPAPPKYKISGTTRDYSELDDYDVSIKFWLPDLLKTAIEEMTAFANTSESDLLRQILFSYLYGRYDLFGLIERGDHRFALNSPALFSRAEIIVSEHVDQPSQPYLGKNDCDVMIRISTQIKQDLTALAEKQNQPLSVFIRHLLVRNLFGHTFMPEAELLDTFEVSIEPSSE